MEAGRPGGPEVDVSDRIAGAAGGVFLPALWLWHTRGEWDLAIPGFLLVAGIGLLGMGLYRLAVRLRKKRVRLQGLFLSGTVAATVVTAVAAWYAEGGLHWRPAVGSVAAGAGVSCWLIFLRLLLWGVPDEARSGP